MCIPFRYTTHTTYIYIYINARAPTESEREREREIQQSGGSTYINALSLASPYKGVNLTLEIRNTTAKT